MPDSPDQSPRWTVPYGFALRQQLHPGEDDYFKKNPHVAGMAAEDGMVILNPYSKLSPKQKQSVINNEAFRLKLRKAGMTPAFAMRPEQSAVFGGSAYAQNPGAQRETTAARIYSGDRSITPTTEQQNWVSRFMRGFGER
jgi:hypothetical protein